MRSSWGLRRMEGLFRAEPLLGAVAKGLLPCTGGLSGDVTSVESSSSKLEAKALPSSDSVGSPCQINEGW